MVCCLIKIWQPGPKQAARAVTASSKAASYPSLPLAMQFILEKHQPPKRVRPQVGGGALPPKNLFTLTRVYDVRGAQS